MRTKTSLTLDESSMPLAKEHAAAEGLDVGRWLDRAIRHEALRAEADDVEAWYATLPEHEQAALAYLDAADRAGVDA